MPFVIAVEILVSWSAVKTSPPSGGFFAFAQSSIASTRTIASSL